MNMPTEPQDTNAPGLFRRRVCFWLRMGLVLSLLTFAIAAGPAIRTARERYTAGVLVDHDVPVRQRKLHLKTLDEEGTGIREKIGSFRMLAWLYNHYAEEAVIEAVDLDFKKDHFDADLHRVTRLPYLDELTIRNLPAERDLSELTSCPRLRRLVLGRSDLDKACIMNLTKLPSLRYLCITRDCKLAPSAVDALVELKQLDWLIVSCEADELDSVRTKLPNCYVSR